MPLYADTVTLWRFAGEEGRRATWQRRVLAGVHVDETSGAVASLHGRRSTSGLSVYIPARAADGYGEGWDVSEGDAVMRGDVGGDAPPSGALRVVGVETHRWGHRLDHVEVAAS